MSSQVTWQRNENQLQLHGQLEQTSLAELWSQRNEVMQGISGLDLSGLSRVDSAGLALLVHLSAIAEKAGTRLAFIGVNASLLSLITLYNLHSVLGTSEHSEN